MAKKCMSAREARRIKFSTAHWSKREALKTIIKDINATPEERWEAIIQLQKCRRDESPSRVRTRCSCCHRPRGVYRRFRLCRNCLRKLCMDGHIPGLVKASW